jgi:hypothetical protein
MTLDKLPIGITTTILAVNGQGALRRHLLDMGLTPHTKVMIRKVAPMGDPIELHLRGYELTLRLEDAKNIVVEGEEPSLSDAPHIQISGLKQKNRLRLRKGGNHRDLRFGR